MTRVKFVNGSHATETLFSHPVCRMPKNRTGNGENPLYRIDALMPSSSVSGSDTVELYPPREGRAGTPYVEIRITCPGATSMGSCSLYPPWKDDNCATLGRDMRKGSANNQR